MRFCRSITFSSKTVRSACRADKHRLIRDESWHIIIPHLYCSFYRSQFRVRKTKIGWFLTQIFSSGARKQPEKRCHFLPITFRKSAKKAVCTILALRKNKHLRQRKELRRSVPVLYLKQRKCCEKLLSRYGKLLIQTTISEGTGEPDDTETVQSGSGRG